MSPTAETLTVKIKADTTSLCRDLMRLQRQLALLRRFRVGSFADVEPRRPRKERAS